MLVYGNVFQLQLFGLQSDLESLLKGLESSIVEVVMAYVKKTNENLIVTG